MFDVTSWKLSNGKIILAYDLGGHQAYYYTSHFLHYNCSQNVVLLCQALGSERYDVTFQWLQATLTRSPECFIIPVLTKADEVPTAQISSCVTKFTTELKHFLENEIYVVEKVYADSKDCEDEDFVTSKLENYKTLNREFESRLFVTSVMVDHPCFDNVAKLCQRIEKHSEQTKYHIEMPKVYEEFYCQLGKIGTVVEERRKVEQSTLKLNEGKIGPELIPSVIHGKVKSEKAKGHNIFTETGSEIEAVNKSEIYSDETISTAHQSSVVLVYSRSQVKKHLDYANNIAGEKLEQLQREGKIILFDEAAKLYEKISKKYPGSCGDVKECLKQFHSYGLCLWFQGHPKIEKIVFNNFSFFEDLLSSLFHHKALDMSFSDLNIDLRRQLFDNAEEIFQGTIKRLREKGLVSKKMFKVLLHQINFEEEVDTVIKLLEILDIGHHYHAGNEPLIFVPYFVDQMETPNEVKKKFPHVLVCSKNEFALRFQLKGNIPSTFWHHLCVKLMDHLHDPLNMQPPVVFRNGLWVVVDKLYLLVYFTGNIVHVVIRGKATSDNVLRAWELTGVICHKIETLIKISWPGLSARILLDCDNCDTHKWPLVEILQSKNNKIFAGCDADKTKRIPSLLVAPPSEGMFSRLFIYAITGIWMFLLIITWPHFIHFGTCVVISHNKM